MMLPLFSPFLLGHAEVVLDELLRFEFPGDAVVSRYFREHRALGHRDRGIIAENLFDVLRHLRSLSVRCERDGGQASPRRLLLANQVRLGRNLRELEALLHDDERTWLAAQKGFDEATLTPAERQDWPDWLYERLVAAYGAARTESLAAALNRPATLDLRVNDLKATRQEVLAQLQAEGIEAEAGKLSPVAVRILGAKPALSRHPLFLSGAIEVQDEGSQMLSLLLQPKRGDMVADFCAGAGGKTLLLGALMHNTGRLYAFDVSEKRLANLKPRLQRSGLSNIWPQRIDSENDTKVKRLAGKLDRVMLDCPCSGLGTLRRNPDMKWRQTPESVAVLTEMQQSILAGGASLVRPGGHLVYATCSLLPEENDAVVDAFLAAHPEFSEVPASESLNRYGWTESDPRLRLLPDQHGTDGFFAVLLRRAG